jgi:hypothetical protein
VGRYVRIVVRVILPCRMVGGMQVALDANHNDVLS